MKKKVIAKWSELEEKKPEYALVADVDLVIIPYKDTVSVLYGRCLHRGALLSDGYIDGDNLICGVHYWDYRYDTGVSEYNNEEALPKFTAGVDHEKNEVEKIIKKLINENDPYPDVIDIEEERGYFWSAEEHHQKYRLQRNKLFLPFVEQELGVRWDEHSYATKLNASTEADFDTTPWVESFSEKAKRIFLIN
jgi:nitrite reductase/ring-hydroxylating ferredoxin subunit